MFVSQALQFSPFAFVLARTEVGTLIKNGVGFEAGRQGGKQSGLDSCIAQTPGHPLPGSTSPRRMMEVTSIRECGESAQSFWIRAQTTSSVASA